MGFENTEEVVKNDYLKPLVIEPKKGWQFIDFQEIKAYKDLFFILIGRDIKIKYSQTVLGGLWAIIQPLFMMIIFSLIFGRYAKIPSDGIPYPIFSFTGMIPWFYFSNSVSQSGNSLVTNMNLISKVYFPRIIIPTSQVLSSLIDFSVSFVVLICMMMWYGIYPGLQSLYITGLILIMVMSSAGLGLILAALNVKYRDIKYTIPFLLQIWMFASPVIYPASVLPEKYRIYYGLNPMAGVIEGFRSLLLGNTPFPAGMISISLAVSVFLFLFGAFYFKQTERFFADII